MFFKTMAAHGAHALLPSLGEAQLGGTAPAHSPKQGRSFQWLLPGLHGGDYGAGSAAGNKFSVFVQQEQKGPWCPEQRKLSSQALVMFTLGSATCCYWP